MARQEAEERRARDLGRVAKHSFDRIGAAAGLFLLAPLFGFLALMIKLTSSGPVFFRQPRLGMGRRPFHIFKFRTMVPDAEARLAEIERSNESEGGVLFKMKRDPRVTPLGSFLRRTSLDEIPQLINVLRGEMSLVGPRPLQLRDSEILRELEPESFARRLEVRPGITGPWQISGRSETGYERLVELDLDYIENWSLWGDAAILWRTVFVVLSRRGAY